MNPILFSLRRLVLPMAAALAGCVGSSPPVRLYHLPAEAAGAVAPAPTTASGGAWLLVLPVQVPEYLDREAFLLPEGRHGFSPAQGHRWAESLRDSVPRMLRQDLARLLGEGRLWTSPPPGLPIARQLRVELTALEAEPERRSVRLRARWTLVDPTGAAAPQARSTTLVAESAGADIDSLVAAHRLALWRLAERIAATP